MGAINSNVVNDIMLNASDGFIYDLSASFTITSTSEVTAISYIPMYSVCDILVQSSAYMTRQFNANSISTLLTTLSSFIAGVFNIQASFDINWTLPPTYINRLINPTVTSSFNMLIPLAYFHSFAKGNPAILVPRWGLADNLTTTPIIIPEDPYM